MTHAVISARQTTEGSQNVPCWRVEVRRPGGAQYDHVFPKAILEWRAAEYGIDPTDIDTLLHVILHEPHLTALEEEGGGPRGKGPTLWEATSTAQAQAAHLQRIQDCPVSIDIAGSKHLDVIRQAPVALDGVRDKARAVDTHRWERLYGGLPKPPKGER